MAEWQEQLNHILSDPDAMAQIASLAQSISRPGHSDAEESGPSGAPPPAEGEGQGSGVDAEALRSMLGGLDPELLGRLTELLRQMDRPESSEATALLLALRPFLSEKRRGKVERAAQLARLIHLGKTFLVPREQEVGHV